MVIHTRTGGTVGLYSAVTWPSSAPIGTTLASDHGTPGRPHLRRTQLRQQPVDLQVVHATGADDQLPAEAADGADRPAVLAPRVGGDVGFDQLDQRRRRFKDPFGARPSGGCRDQLTDV